MRNICVVRSGQRASRKGHSRDLWLCFALPITSVMESKTRRGSLLGNPLGPTPLSSGCSGHSLFGVLPRFPLSSGSPLLPVCSLVVLSHSCLSASCPSSSTQVSSHRASLLLLFAFIFVSVAFLAHKLESLASACSLLPSLLSLLSRLRLRLYLRTSPPSGRSFFSQG